MHYFFDSVLISYSGATTHSVQNLPNFIVKKLYYTRFITRALHM